MGTTVNSPSVEQAKMIAAGLFAWSGWMLVGYRARSIKIGVLKTIHDF